jgi:hypothetical protein
MIEEQMSDERVADGGAQSAEREADYRIADPVTDWVAERAYQVADGGQEAEDQIADDQVVDEENERAELVADQEAGWVADQVAEHIVDGITEIEQQIDRGTLVLLAAAAAAGSSSRHQAGKHTKVSVVSLVQVVDNSTGFQPTKEPKREEESQYSSIVRWLLTNEPNTTRNAKLLTKPIKRALMDLYVVQPHHQRRRRRKEHRCTRTTSCWPSTNGCHEWVLWQLQLHQHCLAAWFVPYRSISWCWYWYGDLPVLVKK